MSNDKILVTGIQRFCTHDGNGVRTVVFFKGCPLNCIWCHNPETKKMKQEILFYSNKCISCGACAQVCPTSSHNMNNNGHVFDRTNCIACGECTVVCPTNALSPAGTWMSVEEIFKIVKKDEAFYGTQGGITLSGGEPMAHAKEAIKLLSVCKEQNITTAVETCGFFDSSVLPEISKYVDEVLWDVKDTNDKRHVQYTGVSNARILDNLRKADKLGVKTVMRCIMVKGVNMDEQHYSELTKLYLEMKNCRGIELLPYHAYSGSKMLPLGQEDNGRVDWIPTKEDMEYVRLYLTKRKANIIGN